MTKKQKRKSVDRENLSPMAKLKLNQRIKSTESMLSGDELDAFRKLSQSEKRDVVQEMLRKAANSAIDAEIIDYFMSEIRVQGGTFSTLSQRHLTIAFLLLSDQPAVL